MFHLNVWMILVVSVVVASAWPRSRLPSQLRLVTGYTRHTLDFFTLQILEQILMSLKSVLWKWTKTITCHPISAARSSRSGWLLNQVRHVDLPRRRKLEKHGAPSLARGHTSRIFPHASLTHFCYHFSSSLVSLFLLILTPNQHIYSHIQRWRIFGEDYDAAENLERLSFRGWPQTHTYALDSSKAYHQWHHHGCRA